VNNNQLTKLDQYLINKGISSITESAYNLLNGYFDLLDEDDKDHLIVEDSEPAVTTTSCIPKEPEKPINKSGIIKKKVEKEVSGKKNKYVVFHDTLKSKNETPKE
jgi:hypothetical protein